MNRFKKILYLLEQNVNQDSRSLARAVSLAKNNQADLTLLRVIPQKTIMHYAKGFDLSTVEVKQKIFESEKSRLDDMARLSGADIAMQTELREGKKYIEAIRTVLSGQYDLVIKEAESHGWLDRFVAGDDMQLLRKCPCPVWLIKPDDKKNYKTIMAATDFDVDMNGVCDNELNDTIVTIASSLALSDFAALHIVNAYDVPEAGFASLWVEQPDRIEAEFFETEYDNSKYQMNIVLDHLRNRLGKESYDYLSPVTHVLRGVPSRELPAMARNIEADLVVMGTVSRSGIAGVIIGNTAETVISELDCSVLVVKPEGFVSPVLPADD